MDRVNQQTARIEVRDWSIWTKHVSGDAALAARLEALPEDSLVTLIVGGKRGQWVKKKDSKTGATTPGLKPIGPMRDIWFDWYKTRRGELLEIIWDDAVDGGAALGARPANRAQGQIAKASPAEQQAAWAAFEALGHAGWRCEGREVGSRDDLHGRGPV
jgi:hypothetical protein